MTCRLLAVFAALWMSSSFLPTLQAQSEIPFTSRADAFERALKSDDLKTRLAGIEEFRGVWLGRSAELVLKWVGRTGEAIRDLERRIARDEEEIAEELYKRVEKPRMTDGKRQEMRTLVEKQLEEVRARVAANNERLAAEREVKEALRELLASVFGNLEGEELDEAARDVVKALDKTRVPEEQVDIIGAMAHADHKEIVAALAETVHRSRFPSVRVAALDALRERIVEESAMAGIEALDDDFQQVRMTAVLLLREVGGAEAVEPLIARLAKEKNTILEDEIVKTLETITRAPFGANARRWSDWWAEWKPKHTGRGPAGRVDGYVDPNERARREREEKAGGSGFYGIQTKAKDVMYILDVNGSMLLDSKGKDVEVGERNIDRAIAELKKSIDNLPSKGSFNIIFYNEKVNRWRDGMLPATEKNKKEAFAWADAVVAIGRTNIFDSLEMAFEIAGRGSFDRHYEVGIEVIFLLSDGSPNEGRIIETQPMIEEVGRLNALKKIQIHTVGLGSGGQGGLLRRLAEQNNGEFVQIR